MKLAYDLSRTVFTRYTQYIPLSLGLHPFRNPFTTAIMIYNRDNVTEIPSVDLLTFLFGAVHSLALDQIQS
jgi:hypothetical protein